MSNWVSVLREFQVPAPALTSLGGKVPVFDPRPQVILFDVYGTLVCPYVGDLAEQARLASSEGTFVAAAERFGFSKEVGIKWHEWFFEAISAEHQALEDKGIAPAEVQVDFIWAEMIARAGGDPGVSQPRMVAAYREMLANPVRAFSGAAEVLSELKSRGMRLGIVSNAQFYTMPIVGLTLGVDPDEFFEPELAFLSYRLGYAKPSPCFFRLVRTTLFHLGFNPGEALVVGNDCENDIQAAQAHGLQTVLFFGNDRSVRLGKAERRGAVITNYESLLAACTM